MTEETNRKLSAKEQKRLNAFDTNYLISNFGLTGSVK